MGRTVGTILGELLDAPSCETHSTLELILADKSAAPHRFATAQVQTEGKTFVDHLRKTGEIVQSAFSNVDRTNSIVQNVDKNFGLSVLNGEIDRARAVVGRFYRDEHNPQKTAFVELFSGEAKPVQVTMTEVQLEIVDDLFAAGYCVADWSFADDCPAVFKDPATCAYAGDETTCNKKRFSKAGCFGRANVPHFLGFEAAEEKNSVVPGDEGGIGGGYGSLGDCFVAELFVPLADGRRIPIGELYERRAEFIGESALAFDAENNFRHGEILNVFRSTTKRLLEVGFGDGSQFGMVKTHRFWTPPRKFVSMCDLKIGDAVLTGDGEKWRAVEIVSQTTIEIAEDDDEVPVFNLLIKDFHDYFVQVTPDGAMFAVSNSKPIVVSY